MRRWYGAEAFAGKWIGKGVPVQHADALADLLERQAVEFGAGDAAKAKSLSDELNKEFPLDTVLQNVALPSVRAATALQQRKPFQAIEVLGVSQPYELGQGTTSYLYPAYLRGEALLQSKQPQRAAAEFRKLLDNPGIVGNFVSGALVHLQLARAQAMMGDTEAARKSYQDFLTLWKDADPDIPIYQQAKAEYQKLQATGN